MSLDPDTGRAYGVHFPKVTIRYVAAFTSHM